MNVEDIHLKSKIFIIYQKYCKTYYLNLSLMLYLIIYKNAKCIFFFSKNKSKQIVQHWTKSYLSLKEKYL